ERMGMCACGCVQERERQRGRRCIKPACSNASRLGFEIHCFMFFLLPELIPSQKEARVEKANRNTKTLMDLSFVWPEIFLLGHTVVDKGENTLQLIAVDQACD
ncbi:hypothetical protein ILYODFUR_037927, partial [Ilyodon furcidens]